VEKKYERVTLLSLVTEVANVESRCLQRSFDFRSRKTDAFAALVATFAELSGFFLGDVLFFPPRFASFSYFGWKRNGLGVIFPAAAFIYLRMAASKISLRLHSEVLILQIIKTRALSSTHYFLKLCMTRKSPGKRMLTCMPLVRHPERLEDSVS